MDRDDGAAAALAENADLRDRLREAESALRTRSGGTAAGDRYRRIIDSAVDYAIIVCDMDGVITDWNGAAELIFGWSAGQMVGRSIETIFTEEDLAGVVHSREMRFALTMGKAQDDRWHRRADGGRFFAVGQMTPLVGDDGEPIGYLKILRDRTSEETNRRELEASRERLQLALDAAAVVGTWDFDVAADRLYADSRFAALSGLDPGRAEKGVPFADFIAGVHPADRERVAADVAAAMAAGGCFAAEYRTIDAAGAVRWLSARGRCAHDAAGRPERFPGAVVDITGERRRAARQDALLRIGDDILASAGPVDHTTRAFELLGQTLGLGRVGYAAVDETERFATIVAEWSGEGIERLDGRFELASLGPDLADALRAGQVVVADVATNALTRDHAAAWAALGIASAINLTVVEGGAVKAILYLHDTRPRSWEDEDIAFVREVLNRSWAFSQRRRAEDALINAETRLRLAHEAADIGAFDYNPTTGELLWDARCRAAFGIFDDEPVGFEASFVAGLHPDDREATLAAAARTLDPAGDGRFDTVYRTIGRDDAVLRWVEARGQTIVEDGRTLRFVGAVRDVTEEKESEERQLLLTRELQHRVKNTLAMVNALANQTLRRAANVKDGLAAFSARLIALSHAHDILTQTSWTSAPIGAIVAESLSTHQVPERRRIAWSGPDVRLTAKQSLALALALHELATNAAKYGALSNEDGRVAIAWRIAPGPEHPRLLFEWRERGGPAVVAPTARGFGSRLIEQSLASEFGGTVEMTYAETGVVCAIEAPMKPDGEETDAG